MIDHRIDSEFVTQHNAAATSALDADYSHLGEQLARTGIDIDTITDSVASFQVAVPSWGVGTGGTRFARFPGPGEPRNVFEKLADCAVINQLTRSTDAVSLHIPWDKPDDASELKQAAEALGLGFDAMNSNTFQDQAGQRHSYKYGSLSHSDAATRAQAVEHNIECIEIGKTLGSTALTVWIADGSNFPGQQHFSGSFQRYIDAMQEVYNALPQDWRIYIEHKIAEPAFYSTVIQDWGSNYLAAKSLGEKAFCLVDLGHHAPSVNIEMIVARLIHFEKLGGFHFNDSKYGDDDLDSGAINPYQLFLVFNELVDAQQSEAAGFAPAYMLDQSHNVTDPLESLMTSAVEVKRAYAQALLIDRKALQGFQNENDALMASNTLKRAFTADVTPILARARQRAGGAIDPVGCYRSAGYRDKVASERPVTRSGSGSGIV